MNNRRPCRLLPVSLKKLHFIRPSCSEPETSQPSTPPAIHPSIHLSIHPSMHLSTHPSIHLSICPSIYPFTKAHSHHIGHNRKPQISELPNAQPWSGYLRWLPVSSNACWWRCRDAAGRSHVPIGKHGSFGWFGVV